MNTLYQFTAQVPGILQITIWGIMAIGMGYYLAKDFFSLINDIKNKF